MKLFLYILSIFLITEPAYSQTFEINADDFKIKEDGFRKAWKNLKAGERYFVKGTKGDYGKALEYYLKAYKYNPNYPELNYKIGYCYLESTDRMKSLYYLQKAYDEKPNITPYVYYELGRSYMYNLEFQKALDFFDKFKESIDRATMNSMKKDLDIYIRNCKVGLEYKQNPVNVIIETVNSVNSEYPDYSPVITADESVMYFTSRRKGTTGNKTDKADGFPYEDIYVSYNIDGEWLPPQNIGAPINTQYHDATVGISPDGNKLLIYRYGDIYISTLDGDKWSEPKRMPESINTPDKVENSACFSFDGKTLYFIRGRLRDKTSNGDIYYSTFRNGRWSRARKLPSNINTSKDEDGVFMHPDGKTLYFSSKGHGGMGGYDIFKTVKQEDGSWSDPVNLGFPINTPDDDIYFVLSADGKHGYYSSSKIDTKGYTDIYKLTFIAKESDTTSPKIADAKLTLVTGYVKDNKTRQPIEAEIEIYDNEANELVLTTKTNKKTGKFLVSLPSGKNYGLLIKSNGYLFHSENFDLSDDEPFKELKQEVELVNIEEGAKTVLKNIFFDKNSAKLRSESYTEINNIYDLLKNNPLLKIEISGHTDNSGTYEFNKKLSEQRAKAVYDYLINKGIDPKRLSYKGYAYDQPIASNKTQEGRQKNRRVEIKIIEYKTKN